MLVLIFWNKVFSLPCFKNILSKFWFKAIWIHGNVKIIFSAKFQGFLQGIPGSYRVEYSTKPLQTLSWSLALHNIRSFLYPESRLVCPYPAFEYKVFLFKTSPTLVNRIKERKSLRLEWNRWFICIHSQKILRLGHVIHWSRGLG